METARCCCSVGLTSVAAAPAPAHRFAPVLPASLWHTRLCSTPSDSPSWLNMWNLHEADPWLPADRHKYYSGKMYTELLICNLELNLSDIEEENNFISNC